MKDISLLGNDLLAFFKNGQEESANLIAKGGSKVAQKNAPVKTGFLSSQTWAFANGKLVVGPEAISATKTISPQSWIQDGVSIIFTSGRTDPNYAKGFFDYAAYLGVYNPGYQKTGKRHWIELFLDPKHKLVEAYLDLGFEKAKTRS